MTSGYLFAILVAVTLVMVIVAYLWHTKQEQQRMDELSRKDVLERITRWHGDDAA